MKLETPLQTLRDVYTRELPYRPTWPRTFELAQSHPVVLALLETLARHQLPAASRQGASHTGRVGSNYLPTLKRAATPFLVNNRPLAPGEVDRKRAASGDRDD